MGLLDSLMGDTPERQQQFGLLMQGLAQKNGVGGLLAANQYAGQAPDRRRQAEMEAMKMRLLQAQVAETNAQAQERTGKLTSAREAQANQNRLLYGDPQQNAASVPPSAFLPPSDGMGPTLPQGAAPVRGGMLGYAASRGIPEQQVLADIQFNKGQDVSKMFANPEVARTMEVMRDGRPVQIQLGKDGKEIGGTYEQWKAPVFQNLGGRTAAIDPVSMGERGSFKQGQSPDSVASNQLGWANNALQRRGQDMTDARSREANSAGPKPQFHDGQWVTPPSAQNPQGAVVPAAGFKKGLGESAKKQVSGIDALGGAIDEYVGELKGFGITDLARPDKRAGMGMKYNNMMLQAKEAYNLGVLNGPDYEILTAVVTDPMTAKGAFTSNAAMTKQAQELKRIMGKVRSAVTGDAAPSSGGATGGWGIKKVE